MRRLKYLIVAFVLGASLLLIGGVAVAHPEDDPNWPCGLTITENYRLHQDVFCEGDGLTVAADGVVVNLRGYTLSGTGVGVAVPNANDVTIRNGTIDGFATGISLGYAQRTAIRGVMIHAHGDHVGLLFNKAPDTLVKSSVVEVEGGKCLYGGPSARADGSRIDRTELRGCIRAVQIGFSDDLTITRSKIVDNGFGLAPPSQVDRWVVEGSLIARNDIGLRMDDTHSWVVRDNRFEDNTYGVRLNGSQSHGNSFDGNVFRQNAVGLYFRYWGDMEDTTITNNRFLDNGSAGLLITQVQLGSLARSEVTGNTFKRNGFSPDNITDSGGAIVDDGFHGYGDLSQLTVAGNIANRNADMGIETPTVIDGGGNTARRNGNPAQCVGVVCD